MSSTAPTSALGADPGFVVQLDAFSGPLDLLLHLLREEQLDIADIPIARIADQFLSIIHDLGLNQAADYLEMAGRLVRLKAQMLLPRRDGEEGWEDPRHELVRRLLEYQLVKEVATWLERSADRRADQYQRGYLPPPPDLPPPPLTLDLLQLLEAVQKVVNDIPSPVLHRVVARPLDTEGATKRLLAMLEEREEFTWLEALGPRPTIVILLSTLLALLELAKRGAIRLSQDGAFSSFRIRRENPETQLARAQEIGLAKEAAEDEIAEQKKAVKREAFLKRLATAKARGEVLPEETDTAATDTAVTDAAKTETTATDIAATETAATDAATDTMATVAASPVAVPPVVASPVAHEAPDLTPTQAPDEAPRPAD